MDQQRPSIDATLEAEQALIGAVLINNDALRVVDGLVRPDDFFEDLHRHLWQTMLDAEHANRRIDPKLLISALGDDAKAVVAPGVTVGKYIARLAAEATTIINAPDYARTIRDIADGRRLGEIGNRMQFIRGMEPSEVAVGAIDAIDEILSARAEHRKPTVTMESAVKRAVEAAASAYQTQGKITGVTWGLHALDRKTLGMHAGELIIMAGRPGMGKTAVALSVARKAAATAKTLFVSLEMNDAALAQRMLADELFDHNPIPYWTIQSGRFSESEFPKIKEAEARLASLPISIEQQASLTVSQIAARARQHHRRYGIDLLVVDHLHLVRPSDRYKGHRVEEIGEITRGLKTIARDLDVPVLALCQLSRAVEGRDDKRPTLADLRGSGDIEQDADVVMMIYREAYYLDRRKPDKSDGDALAKWFAQSEKARNKLEILIEKQRNGPVGPVPTFCSIAHNAVRNLIQTDEDDDASDSEVML